MKIVKCITILTLIILYTSTYAEKILIAAAADLKFAMDQIVNTYQTQHPTDSIEVVYGSSGQFFAQIKQGAPYDLFFSADIDFPTELLKKDLAASQVKPYAIGRIVLWSNQLDASQHTLNDLADPQFKHIAMANPKHAPYGKRAEEALRSVKLWDKIESKLVYGENIAQTTQFVQTGNAQIGIIALSLALSPELAAQGKYWLIPDTLHTSLKQGYIITKRAKSNLLAKDFSGYMDTKVVRKIMAEYGFVLPTKTLK